MLYLSKTFSENVIASSLEISALMRVGTMAFFIKEVMKAENVGFAIASLTVSKPASIARPQVNVCEPFNSRNFNSLNLSIFGAIITPLPGVANESMSCTFCASDCIAQRKMCIRDRCLIDHL